jgi:DNA-binding CsgD family transcriptional regulator
MVGAILTPHIGQIPDIHPRHCAAPAAAPTIDWHMEQSAPARPAALLEREHEVEQIRAALNAVVRGAGEALVIEGEAGMGKSRLLEETRAWASDVGVRLFNARATELEQGFPFGVVRQLFERPLVEADAATRERWLAGAAALAADVVEAPTTAADAAGSAAGDPGYAWQHGLYWLASNLAADAPLALVVDDLQWSDARSAGALAFIARRLEGQPLALVVATRPLEPTLTPEAAALVGDPAVELLRPSPLTETAISALVAARLAKDPDGRFVRACLEATGGNPFLVHELLEEAAARGLDPTAATASDVGAIVPRGIANAVLLRLARLPPAAASLARALSALGDAAHVGDAARLAGLGTADLEAAMAALVSASVVEPGGTIRFAHPVLRAAIYGDLSPAERERLHLAAVAILRERGAPADQTAAQVMHTAPAGDPAAVEVLRDAARHALALGDAAGAAALLSRALDEPPSDPDRPAVLLALGQARARAGAPDAVAPLTEIVEGGEDPAGIAAAAIELSDMLFYARRAADGAAVLRRAQKRLSPGDPACEQLAVALLGVTYTSASALRDSDAVGDQLREADPSGAGALQATTLARLAMDEVMYLRSATTAIELAERALAAGLPLKPQGAGNWAIMALVALSAGDALDAAHRAADEILAQARARGAALTVATTSALRAHLGLRRGDLLAAQADAETAIELAPDLLGAEFPVVLAVGAAVLVGLERDETPDALRRLIERTGARYDDEFLPSSQLRYASGVLRAAAGKHEAAIEELRGCGLDHPVAGSENPATLSWRSAAALSLAELGRHGDARILAADEVRRARSFGAARAIGVALRAQAIVGPRAERRERLEEALAALAPSPARLEHARVLVDLGAALRAAGRRTAAREPLVEALEIAARCGARTLERRARAELGAIGIRPRATDRSGADSLTPSERRVADLAASGGSNKEIAQTLFVTEKTVETHLGRAFRKLDISSRRQLPAVLVDTVA